MENVVVVAGGIIPEEDIPALEKAGIKAVFGPGTPTPDIAEAVKKLAGK
jgi:methylmalonyl-CoA mutase C-terminal domain/subunit